MSNASPFSGTRFEFEYRHLYFLQEDRYARLEQPKPCILIGSRGTGKTTLLRSLSWRERLQNEGLRRQLGDRGFKNYIGVYIKLPDVQLDAIAQWLETADPIIRRALFSRYLELIQLQEILDAVSDLEAAGELQFPADRERAEVRAILDEFGDEVFAPDGGTREPKSLSDLANSMRRLRRIIEKRSQERASTQEAFNSVGSPHQISLLSRRVCERLSRLISKNAKAPIIFKVCFDEAETLDPYGIKILATWIRLAAIPLFHVFSFVSKPETFSETFLPGLTTQSADVAEIDLDGVPNARFREFVEGVTTLRLEEVWKDTASPVRISRRQPFKTEAHFGKLNINSLLEDILRDSVSPLAKEILSREGYPPAMRTPQEESGETTSHCQYMKPIWKSRQSAES